MSDITFLSADKLREIQYIRQLEFVYQKIIESVKNFRTCCFISSDLKIQENVIEYIKGMGYKVKITCNTTRTPYIYSYDINWR